jgi:hypothetical protein
MMTRLEKSKLLLTITERKPKSPKTVFGMYWDGKFLAMMDCDREKGESFSFPRILLLSMAIHSSPWLLMVNRHFGSILMREWGIESMFYVNWVGDFKAKDWVEINFNFQQDFGSFECELSELRVWSFVMWIFWVWKFFRFS